MYMQIELGKLRSEVDLFSKLLSLHAREIVAGPVSDRLLFGASKIAWRFCAIAAEVSINLPFSVELEHVLTAKEIFSQFIEDCERLYRADSLEEIFCEAKSYLGDGINLVLPEDRRLAAAVKLTKTLYSTRSRLLLATENLMSRDRVTASMEMRAS